jgi:hypothetical protein
MESRYSSEWTKVRTGALGDHPFVVAVATISGLLGIVVMSTQILSIASENAETPTETSSMHRDATVASKGEGVLSAASTIRVNQPKDGELVDQFVNVSYQGGDAGRTRRLLVVRDPIGQYWNWGRIAAGEVRRVQLGLPEQDRGRPFEIGILTTEESIAIGVPNHQRPSGPFTSVTVRRR